MKVEVVRSARRKKTVELRPTPDGVRISIPARATKAEEERYVRELLAKYKRKHSSEQIDLTERARQLSSTYNLPTPTSIKWVDNQNQRWGSCTPSLGTIRISSAAVRFPTWVIDYIVVHELAHLLHFGHDANFWAVVSRYPLSERARGFLIAKSGQRNDDGDQHDDVDGVNVNDDLSADNPPLSESPHNVANQLSFAEPWSES